MSYMKVQLSDIIARYVSLSAQHRIGTDRYGTPRKELFFIISDDISNYAISTFGRLAYNLCGKWILVKYDNYTGTINANKVTVSDTGEFSPIPFDSPRYKKNNNIVAYEVKNGKKLTESNGKPINYYRKTFFAPNGKHLIYRNGSSKAEWIEVETLMKWAFFPNLGENYKLFRVNPERNIHPQGYRRNSSPMLLAHTLYKYDINEMYLLDKAKNEHIEFLRVKLANYSDCYDFNGKVLIPSANELNSEKAERMCSNMMKRANDPTYSVTMCEAWAKNRSLALQFLLRSMYDYPLEDPIMDALEVDKDLFSRFEVAEYSPKTCAILPKKINLMFERTNRFNIKKEDDLFVVRDKTFRGEQIKKLCSTFKEALQTACALRADRINDCVTYECPHMNGAGEPYIPLLILSEMKKFAMACREGKIRHWMPTPEQIKELGVID